MTFRSSICFLSEMNGQQKKPIPNMAGYVSANVFCQGLSRVSGTDLTAEGYIAAMESAPINVPMGTSVDYSNGKRVGIDALALNKYTPADAAAGGSVYRGITGLGELEAAIRG